MCYVHLDQAQIYQDELTTDQWMALIDEACEAGLIDAKLTGGECLLYHGFGEIYAHLQSKGTLMTVLTNGTLLDEETVGWLAERSPQRIQISVYGSSPEGYKNVTGNAEAFYRADKAIDIVKKAGIPLDLAITVTKQMIPDFEAVLEYCQAKNPLNYRVAVFPFEPRKETGRAYEDFLPSLDERIKVYKTRAKLDGRYYVPFSCEEELLSSRTDPDEEEIDIKGICCAAGRMSFSVNWNGKMTPCNAFDTVEADPLKDGFHTAWQSINKWSCEYTAPTECSNCKYRRACIPCPAVHMSTVGAGRINPLVCEETRRAALEGIRKL